MGLTDQQASEGLERERGRMFAIAYGMLGSRAEAEDVVQEAFVRWHGQDRSAVRSPAAFLTTTVTRLAIDRLRSAERRRVEYVGPWLPEPLVSELDAAEVVSEAEQLSLALLAALERLNPIERAVFLLRDVFDFDYAEIAEIVDKTEANCRQIGRRARTRVGEPLRRFRPTQEEERELLGAFVAATQAGELEALTRLLARDAVLWTDGGGKVKGALQPVYGAERIARFLIALASKEPPGLRIRPIRVNGDPGLRTDTASGPRGVVALELAEGVDRRDSDRRQPREAPTTNDHEHAWRHAADEIAFGAARPLRRAIRAHSADAPRPHARHRSAHVRAPRNDWPPHR
jgi:RNA polymerase sigma-70 factor (ECF subfamily)